MFNELPNLQVLQVPPISNDIVGQEIEQSIDPAQDVISSASPVPEESAPSFRVFWRAWKDGNNSKGESESTMDTSQMARAEVMTKLYDLGFSNIEILAIETINQDTQDHK